jgi:hypothetical protein
MSGALSRLALELLVGMEELQGEDPDADQVLNWMADIGAAIGDLDAAERADFVRVARELAAEAEAAGEGERAEAYARVADAEDMT